MDPTLVLQIPRIQKIPVRKVVKLELVSLDKVPIIKTMFLDVVSDHDNVNQNAFTSTSTF